MTSSGSRGDIHGNFQRPPLNHSYASATKMFQLQVPDHGTSLLKNIEWIPFSIKCNKNNSTGKQQQALRNLALKTSYYLAAIALPALPFSLFTPVCSDQALHSCSSVSFLHTVHRSIPTLPFLKPPLMAHLGITSLCSECLCHI